MSRGHGAVQRKVLAHLGNVTGAATVRQLACVVYDTDSPTVANERSVRRAIRTLECEGHVRAILGRIGRVSADGKTINAVGLKVTLNGQSRPPEEAALERRSARGDSRREDHSKPGGV
jgi:hypothetical protein